MSRLIMRAYWGINDNSHRILRRKALVDKNILAMSKAQNSTEFITYVWGKDNYDSLNSMGFKCVLMKPEPFQWDLVKCQYRHKLEALRFAMEEEKCDELLHVDWDCIPQKKADENMWKLLSEKQSFQANLIRYKHKKATWRKEDRTTIPNGGCVYIKDKTVPSQLIKIWETMQGPSAEPAMAKYCDDVMGGWQGIDKYWELFEIPICNVHRMSPYTLERKKSKNVYFIHYQG